MGLIGSVFGRITVTDLHSKDSSYRKYYLCKCLCGNETVVRGDSLTSGKTLSCGCLQKEMSSKSSTTHGLSGEKSYFQDYYRENKERICIRSHNYYVKNRERTMNKMRAYSLWYKKTYKKKHCDSQARRMLAIKERTPLWLSELDKCILKNMKKVAKKITSETGCLHVTDHIIPLRGKRVSGLNIPDNIQIITNEQNASKGYSFAIGG